MIGAQSKAKRCRAVAAMVRRRFRAKSRTCLRLLVCSMRQVTSAAPSKQLEIVLEAEDVKAGAVGGDRDAWSQDPARF